MADQQPEDQPAAGMPDPTRVESGEEPSTVDAPARFSGSASVPPPGPKKSRFSRRLARLERSDEPAPAEATSAKPAPAEPASAAPVSAAPADHWANTPAVDPWAGQDTPWEPFTLAEPPAPAEMPPTRVEAAPPPTRVEAPPPTRVEPPPPTRVEPPPAAAGPPPSPPRAPAGLPPTPPPVSVPGPPTAPAPPAPVKPKKLTRRERKAQRQSVNRLPVQTRPPTPPAPPPWAPQAARRPLPPPRRKRRWGRRLALLSLLGVVCCCGLPFAYFQFPAARQHPVRAVLPQTFADLQRRDDAASERAAERLAEQVRGTGTGSDGVFTGVYGDKRGKRVTVFGVTGFRLTPGGDVQDQLDRLTTEFDLQQVEEFNLGETGAHERCGAGRVDGASVVVCAWADHGSLATVLLTRRSVTDSAELVSRLRNEVLTPG
jgi:hypothetical protein